MAHKTITISEEAYEALARVKRKDESFTKVILRLTKKKSPANLLEYVRSFSPDEELASAVEKVVEMRRILFVLEVRSSRRGLMVCCTEPIEALERDHQDLCR